MKEELPRGWAPATSEDLASAGKHSLGIGPFGSDLKVSDYRESGVPLIFVRNIRSESFLDSNTKYISPEKAAELIAHQCRPGDVLITKMGEPPGDSTVYPLTRPQGVVTADCIRWRIDPRLGEPRFFAYETRTDELRQQILGITQGVAQRKVSLSRFRNVQYRVAPPAEQHRIVEAIESYFTRLDDAAATLERAQRNLKRYRASVLKAAVEGRLVPTEAELARAEGRDYEPASVLLERILAERRRRWEENELAKMKAKGKAPTDDKWKAKYEEPTAPNIDELAEIPEGWCWATVDQLLSNHDGGRVPVKRADRAERHGKFPYYGASGVIDRIDDFLFDGDFLLVGEDGANLLSRSTPIAFQAHGQFWVNNHAHVLQTYLGLPLGYVEAFFNATDLARYVTGTAQPKLPQAAMNKIPVPLCPADEQRRIVEAVQRQLSIADGLDHGCATNEQRGRRLHQSILKWAFEGRLVDQDPTDEPASVLLQRIRAERAASAAKMPARAAKRKTSSA